MNNKCTYYQNLDFQAMQHAQQMEYYFYLNYLYLKNQQNSLQQQHIQNQSHQIFSEVDQQNTMSICPLDQNLKDKLLNLDDLIKEGKIYDWESPQNPEEKRQTRNRCKQQPDVTKNVQIQKKQISKFTKVQQPEKQVKIGLKHQQLQFPQSGLKPRLFQVYKNNEKLFQQLKRNLEQIIPKCTEMDVTRLLELAGNNFNTAFSMLKQNESFVSYYLEVQSLINNKQDLSDQIIIKKK